MKLFMLKWARWAVLLGFREFLMLRIEITLLSNGINNALFINKPNKKWNQV